MVCVKNLCLDYKTFFSPTMKPLPGLETKGVVFSSHSPPKSLFNEGCHNLRTSSLSLFMLPLWPKLPWLWKKKTFQEPFSVQSSPPSGVDRIYQRPCLKMALFLRLFCFLKSSSFEIKVLHTQHNEVQVEIWTRKAQWGLRFHWLFVVGTSVYWLSIRTS